MTNKKPKPVTKKDASQAGRQLQNEELQPATRSRAGKTLARYREQLHQR